MGHQVTPMTQEFPKEYIQNFSATQILHEIKNGNLRSPNIAILIISKALTFYFCAIFLI